ncbi:hypothetical protein D3C71_1343160 [compost metagenome]
MEMARVQAQGGLAAGGVTHVELVRANGIAFCADAEQFAFHRINVMRRIQFFTDHLVERLQQTLARSQTVHGDVFHAVRDPDVHHRRRAKLFTEVG